MKPITSADNPGFKRWLRLAESAREVRVRRQTLAEGAHIAEAIHASGHPVDAVLVRRGLAHGEARQWAQRLIDAGAPGFELAPSLFDRLAPVERGTGLLLQIPVPSSPEPTMGDTLLLDGVQEPGNAGALLRVAAAGGVRNVLATPGTVALWTPKVLRGAQGAHFRLCVVEEMTAAGARAKFAIPWFGATAHGGAPLWRADLTASALGFVVGSEGAGLSPDAAAICTQMLTIPLSAGVESLNVTAAAAVFVFERCRQMEARMRARTLPSA